MRSESGRNGTLDWGWTAREKEDSRRTETRYGSHFYGVNPTDFPVGPVFANPKDGRARTAATHSTKQETASGFAEVKALA